MRIIAGRHKGRKLAAPKGDAVRPTSDRARQALFDMLWHAPWAGRGAVEGARVLDAFAGTGALGLEALSRGASHATFLESGREALAALRLNIAACKAGDETRVIPGDALKPPRATQPCSLVFLDPPYGKGLAGEAIPALAASGWVAPGAVVCAELGPADAPPELGWEVLAERAHGKARLLVLRAPA